MKSFKRSNCLYVYTVFILLNQNYFLYFGFDMLKKKNTFKFKLNGFKQLGIISIAAMYY